jgi:hypothetical protein
MFGKNPITPADIDVIVGNFIRYKKDMFVGNTTDTPASKIHLSAPPKAIKPIFCV